MVDSGLLHAGACFLDGMICWIAQCAEDAWWCDLSLITSVRYLLVEVLSDFFAAHHALTLLHRWKLARATLLCNDS